EMRVDLHQGFARLTCYFFRSKPGWECLVDCVPVEPGAFGWSHPRGGGSRTIPFAWFLQYSLPLRRLFLERGERLFTLSNLSVQSSQGFCHLTLEPGQHWETGNAVGHT